jgi:hypothetical protein
MAKKFRRKNSPYWSFWKVVLAGWCGRYPRQIFWNPLIRYPVCVLTGWAAVRLINLIFS